MQVCSHSPVLSKQLGEAGKAPQNFYGSGPPLTGSTIPEIVGKLLETQSRKPGDQALEGSWWPGGRSVGEGAKPSTKTVQMRADKPCTPDSAEFQPQ